MGVKMKLLNQFTILKKNLGDIDYINKEKVDFWGKGCEEYPTHKHCLVYCD